MAGKAGDEVWLGYGGDEVWDEVWLYAADADASYAFGVNARVRAT